MPEAVLAGGADRGSAAQAGSQLAADVLGTFRVDSGVPDDPGGRRAADGDGWLIYGRCKVRPPVRDVRSVVHWQQMGAVVPGLQEPEAGGGRPQILGETKESLGRS